MCRRRRVVAAVHGVDPEVLAAVPAGRGAALDAPLQVAVVQHLGADVGAVRVYTGAEADLLSAQAGRMAFTVGDALIFGQGAYRPETPEGQRLLAEGLAAALEHGPGAHGPTPRAVSVTDGGGGGIGGHGEGVGAVHPLAAASPFAGTGATGGHATATQLLPLIRQVYAHPHQAGVHPHVAADLHAAAAPLVVPIPNDPSTLRQVMDGWGTSLAWWANMMGAYAPGGQPGQLDPQRLTEGRAVYDEVMEILSGDGVLRLDIVRCNVPFPRRRVPAAPCLPGAEE